MKSEVMKKIGIFGTSGFAREVADIAEELGYSSFFIARDKDEVSAWSGLGDVVIEDELDLNQDLVFAIGVGENAIRQRIAERYAGRFDFINLIHPSATFGRGVRENILRQKGVIVCAGVRFTHNITIGDFTVFNLNATVGHDVVIEGFVNVAPGANISGNVYIKSSCWIGTGAVINQGTNDRKLCIGLNTVVGSGAVVIKDCEEQAVYVGAPARRIK